jgi:hypothetical protein
LTPTMRRCSSAGSAACCPVNGERGWGVGAGGGAVGAGGAAVGGAAGVSGRVEGLGGAAGALAGAPPPQAAARAGTKATSDRRAARRRRPDRTGGPARRPSAPNSLRSAVSPVSVIPVDETDGDARRFAGRSAEAGVIEGCLDRERSRWEVPSGPDSATPTTISRSEAVQLRRRIVEDAPLHRLGDVCEGGHGVVEVPVRVV